MRDYFEGSKTSGKYKQCANKSSRAECKCADNMKLSFSVAFSDCKEKALRMKFPVEKLPLYFMVEDEGYFFNLTSPYFVTIKEVNNRTNWKISGTNETLSLTKLRMHLESKVKTKLYNPDGLTISITGSELFHFRVSTIPGVSFCNLFDEFQIYIDDSPLAFPGQYLISTIVAVSIGGILFTAFLLHIYEIQITATASAILPESAEGIRFFAGCTEGPRPRERDEGGWWECQQHPEERAQEEHGGGGGGGIALRVQSSLLVRGDPDRDGHPHRVPFRLFPLPTQQARRPPPPV
ncbi:cation channel sperm-associated protein subunit beta [Crotalus adamanteus]|uniref:Cation channel sperm-associated protein subunit beta n=1 Tax=Crotalus adamanteus TaxID=8729 RepID=A0AAW1C508_CROAD